MDFQPFPGKLRTVNPFQPEVDIIAWAAACLQNGGVLIYPTETFYGLGGNPCQETVITRIFRLKGRDGRKPLPLIAADEAAARRTAAFWPEAAEHLARAFWPGPLTLIVAASSLFPPILHAHTGKIAIRVSSHAVARRLAAGAGGLLIATSANLSEQAPCNHPDRLSPELLRQVDAVLHAGPTPGGKPSTLVDVSVEPSRLLRAGVIEWERIRSVLV